MTALNKKDAIIVDLDGTMCDTSHRQHLVDAKKWDEFYEALDHDPINQWCDDVVWAVQNEMRWKIIYVSGRPEKYRKKTVAWFTEKWGVEVGQDEDFKLFMRKDGDFRQDAIIKKEIYQNHIEPFFNVKLCIDDRKQVVDMWRSLGLVCFQCAEGDF